MPSTIQGGLAALGGMFLAIVLTAAAFHIYTDHVLIHELQVQADTIGQLTELIRKTLVEELHPEHFIPEAR